MWNLVAAVWGEKQFCWFAELNGVIEVFAKSSWSSQLKQNTVGATLANTDQS